MAAGAADVAGQGGCAGVPGGETGEDVRVLGDLVPGIGQELAVAAEVPSVSINFLPRSLWVYQSRSAPKMGTAMMRTSQVIFAVGSKEALSR